jgi:hypothetical protein
MKTIGALLIAATAGLAMALSLATRCWFAVCLRCQMSKTALTQRLLLAETTRTFNEHKVAVPRAGRLAGVAAKTGRCEA